MPTLARVVINLTGWNGAPGVNVLHFSGGSTSDWTSEVVLAMCDEVVQMTDDLKEWWAPGITMQLRPDVDIIDVATGDIVDQVAPSPAFGPISSTGASGQESRATQAVVRFKGDRWVRGRRIQGRMFLGPLNSAIMASDGTIADENLPSIPDAFEAMISGLGTRLAVYSRPNPGLARAGDYADVTSVSCSKTPGILSKRRD